MKRSRCTALFLISSLVIAFFCCCSTVNAGTEWKIPFGPREGHTVSRMDQKFNGRLAVGTTAMKALDDGSVLILDSTYERIVELTPQGIWKQAISIPRPGAEWKSWIDFVRLQDGRFLLLNYQGGLYLLDPVKGVMEKLPLQFPAMNGINYIDAGLSTDSIYLICPGHSCWTDLKGAMRGKVDHSFFKPVIFEEKQAIYGVNHWQAKGDQGIISMVSFEDKGKQIKRIVWKKRNPALKLQGLSVLSTEPSGHIWIEALEGKTGNYQGMVRYIAKIDSSGKASSTFAIPLWYGMNRWKSDVVANRKGNVFQFRTDERNLYITRYR